MLYGKKYNFLINKIKSITPQKGCEWLHDMRTDTFQDKMS